MEKNEDSKDRRILRTRRLLQSALTELMMEKSFRDITVRDITDLADVNRSTFYLHYQDTYDLLRQIEDRLIDELEQKIMLCRTSSKPYTLRSLIECVYDFLEENSKSCRPLFLPNSNTPFGQKFIELLSVKGIGLPPAILEGRENIRSFQLTFIVNGVIGVLQKWFLGETELPKNEMADLMDKLVNTSILAV